MAKLKKRKDGYFRVWYKGKQFLGKTIAEAEAKRNAYQYEVEHGIEQLKKITLFDFVEQWLPVAKANVTRHTYNHYANIMEMLTDECGNKQISAVTPNDIKKVWNKFSGKSQSYINKARYLYNGMFSSAIEEGCCRINPCAAKSAKPARGSTGTHRCLTDEEIRLIETVPDRMQFAAMMMLKAGLRRGEVLALDKEHIHNDKIWITNALQFTGNRSSVGKTKTESSVRTVPLFDDLRPFVEQMDKYIFCTVKGEISTKKSFESAWKSYMNHLSEIAGHEISFRPHDLRHTFITHARDLGIDIHIVMQWVGHASEKMILQIYDHPSAIREQNAVKIMNGTVEKQ